MMMELKRRHFLYASAAGVAGAIARPALAQQSQQSQQSKTAEPSSAGPANSAGLPVPGQRKGRFLQHNGAKIFYQTFGKGEPIVLLHGYPLSGALFAGVVDKLSQDHLVVLIDHRGYGQSTAPDDKGSVEIYADDALAVLDELKLDKATIGGMSMGGPIVFAMHKKAPDRFSGMILIDTTAAKASPPRPDSGTAWPNGSRRWASSRLSPSSCRRC